MTVMSSKVTWLKRKTSQFDEEDGLLATLSCKFIQVLTALSPLLRRVCIRDSWGVPAQVLTSPPSTDFI